ncbi:MAG: MFS transporter [Actinobacteria bacterium HGW-Actinobacteria-4]|nr:MAG: MFS transporter [Actinobacteria bacterium HGW-Actinobacteria-4]
MNQTFRSLSIPNYRLWFVGALVSNIGTWMQRIAQDWLVLTVLTQNSGVAVGITTGLQFLPFLLFSAWAGVIADRVDQRRLLIVTQSAAGALGLGLGALVLSGHVQLWHVYAFAFALGCVTALDAPARQVFVAKLVPVENLPNAVGLNSASFNGARLIGPASAGFIIALAGTGWVFIINGLTFIAAIVALVAMKSATMQEMKRVPRSPGQIREGIRYVKSRADIVVIMVIVSVVSTFGFNFQLTSALMARVEFGRGPSDYGIIGSVLAIGSVAGALMAAHRERVRVRLVIASAFAFAVASLATALAPTFTLYLIACVPLGFFALTMITAANATIQTTTEPAMRGRVMALYMLVFVGATPIGSPIVGFIGEEFGARWAIGIGSIAAFAVALAAAAWSIRHWDLEVTYHLHRPRIRVLYPHHRAAIEAEREEARQHLRNQQIEDISNQP